MTTLSEAVFFARNLLAAESLIKAVPKKQVDLTAFVATEEKPVAESVVTIHTCGAVACLGGWVAVAPHFRALGVVPNETSNAPWIPSLGMEDPDDVADFLFGNGEMFSPRGGSDYDQDIEDSKSDRKAALHRLKARLKELLEEHDELKDYVKSVVTSVA